MLSSRYNKYYNTHTYTSYSAPKPEINELTWADDVQSESERNEELNGSR